MIAARGKGHLVKMTELHDLVMFAPPTMAAIPAPFDVEASRSHSVEDLMNNERHAQ